MSDHTALQEAVAANIAETFIRLPDSKYTEIVKASLRDDVQWAMLVAPALESRTRQTLHHMLDSIDGQKIRVLNSDTPDDKWLGRISKLRGYVSARLDAMAPVEQQNSSSKEAKAWKGFSARLATALEENDQTALDRLKAPYGGMTARQWLAARGERA